MSALNWHGRAIGLQAIVDRCLLGVMELKHGVGNDTERTAAAMMVYWNTPSRWSRTVGDSLEVDACIAAGDFQRDHEIGDAQCVLDKELGRRSVLGRPIDAIFFAALTKHPRALRTEPVDHWFGAGAMKIFELRPRPIEHTSVIENVQAPDNSLPSSFDEFPKMWRGEEPVLRHVSHNLEIAWSGLI